MRTVEEAKQELLLAQDRLMSAEICVRWARGIKRRLELIEAKAQLERCKCAVKLWREEARFAKNNSATN